MAIKIELPRPIVTAALTNYMQSLTRAADKQANKMIEEIQRKEIAEIQTAINTLAEVK